MDFLEPCSENVLRYIGSIVTANVSDTKEEVLSSLCASLKADVACVLVPGREPSSLSAEGIWYRDDFVPHELSFSARTAPVPELVRSGLPRCMDRASPRSKLSRCLRQALDQPIGPMLVGLLPQREGFAGVVLIARLADGVPFTPQELETFSAMTSVAGLAIENQSLRREAGQLRDKVNRLDSQMLQSAKLVATGKLAASIAHEINNPLQSVQSCIYLVNDSLMVEGPGRQYLEIAREELDRIGKIVQRLTDFYRPSQEGPKAVDVNHVLDSVLVLMGKRIQHGHVAVDRTCSTDVPAVQASPDQIKQVFVNLILNAIEAMPAGGRLELCTGAVDRGAGCFVEVSFKDSGEGISRETVGRIFDPFFTTKAKGTGLGLSISHDIIERHGGMIRVESTPNGGSTFVVSLPAIAR